jgi:hypothetical protein
MRQRQIRSIHPSAKTLDAGHNFSRRSSPSAADHRQRGAKATACAGGMLVL